MQERDIDLLILWDAIKRNLITIIFSGILFGGAIYLYSTMIVKPKYEATTSMIISQSNRNEITNSDLQINDLRLNQELVNTYSEIIKTRGISNIVIENLGLDLNYEQFNQKVSVTQKGNTEIFGINVIDVIPERAKDIANETSEVFKEAIVEIMKTDNVQILDEAVLPEEPISPNVLRNTLLGFIIGLFLSAAFFILKELLDTTIKTSDDVSEALNIPVLGVLPDVKRPIVRKS